MFDIIRSTATILSPEVTTAVHDLLLNVLQLVSLLVVSSIGLLVKKYINSLNSAWKQKLAYRFVAFAEQRLTANDEKLNYAKGKLKEFFPRLSNEEIEHLVEESVSSLRASTKPVGKK